MDDELEKGKSPPLAIAALKPWLSAFQEIDSALLKLASEFDHDRFISMLTTSKSFSDILEDARSWLAARHRHFALGLLDWFDGRAKDALNTWDR